MKFNSYFIRLICFGITTLSFINLIGCNTEDDVEEITVNFVEVTPADGSTIQINSKIIVVFDRTPTDLSVTGAEFSLSETDVTITVPSTPGPLKLELAWSDDEIALTYTVEIPTPPKDMVFIPAGEFEMGHPHVEDDPIVNDIFSSALPVHTVYVDAFYIDKYEVTKAQFVEFLNAVGKHEHAGHLYIHERFLGSWLGDDGTYHIAGEENQAMGSVTWYGAMAYAIWAKKRLPTEAEWEKAARGGLESLRYPWGNDYDTNYVVLGSQEVIGQFPPNGYGLYDIAGNVQEWCLDEYDPNFYANSPTHNPLAGAVSVEWLIENYTEIDTHRVLRGGSGWGNLESWRTVSHRFGTHHPSHGDYINGLRCVKDISH